LPIQNSDLLASGTSNLGITLGGVGTTDAPLGWTQWGADPKRGSSGASLGLRP
jgi:hypothetical protein